MKLFSNKRLTNFHIFLTCLFASILSSNALATDNKLKWKSVGAKSQVTKQLLGKGTVSSLEARLLELDEISFQSSLNELFDSNSSSLFARKTNTTTSQNVLTLPLPDGSEVSVKITPSAVMSDLLKENFPQIKTWKVTGVSEDITGAIDFTHHGFHAMLLMPDGDTIFIEPNNLDVADDSSKKAFSENGQYLSFSKHANKESFKSDFSCGVHSDSPLNFNSETSGLLAGKASLSEKLLARPASDLITYRLAIAVTGEYTEFHGGTVSSALSAITTTIARVNEIYERDLGVSLQLIDEQSELIYLDSTTDPYSNNNTGRLVTENIQNLSSSGVLSTAQYDIGHVFGTGGGGLATLGSVCDNSSKAGGATGLSSPIGDAFDVEFVAHELGHQMGGTHTFNSACGGGGERQGITAVEPGSGSTVMSYAGICQENDIQFNADDYFHAVSIAQIRDFSRDGEGSSCGSLTNTGNENPTVNAGNDFTVPARTPVVFTATGADTDNDALSYTWEQTDTGSLSDVNVDTGDNALFRSRLPSSSGTRFIPRLTDLFNSTISNGELLPVTNRTMEMVSTVRDGKGGLQTDLVNMNVFDTGESFSVTSHATSEAIGRGDQETISWNVAGTDSSPISCANVDIGIATVDGDGIDIATTPNDGQQQITIPTDTPDMNNARFIVSCATSGFFNVSSGNLSVGDSNVDDNIDNLDEVGESNGGGGSMNIFILSLFSLLLLRRKYSF